MTQSDTSPGPCHPEQMTQDRVQLGFESLQRGRLHALPGQPIPVLRYPQFKVLSRAEMKLFVF